MTVPRSNISWTDFSGGDANFAIGCTKVSPGCAHCYAEAIIKRAGRDFADVRTYPEKLRRLQTWKFKDDGRPFRRGPGARPMCFVVDMGDLFHERVPDAFITDALTVMCHRTDIDWQILTKRIKRAAAIFQKFSLIGVENIWLGLTVEDQQRADERIATLLRIPAAVRFLSCEPMLGPLDLSKWLSRDITGDSLLDWLIVGGESGPHRRPFDPAWAPSLRDQCKSADIPFHYKQGSAFRPGQDDLLDGVAHKEFPR